MEEFHHSPLEGSAAAIRLVELLPGNVSDVINCNITHLSPSSAPPYEALSYAWGDWDSPLPLRLNGKQFWITQNLHAALRHLRNKPATGNDVPHTARLFWIDAICIDQSNVEERNEQVRRMRSIYQNSVRVVVWLGQDHEPEDDIVKFSPDVWGFESLQRGSMESTAEAFVLLTTLASMYQQQDHQVALDAMRTVVTSRREAWGYLRRLFSRKWFQRRWVIQEVIVSRAVVCAVGSNTIDWGHLEKAAAFIVQPTARKIDRLVSWFKFLPLMRAERVCNVGLNGVDPGNILTIIRHVQEANCSDPRDKLYALQGIVSGDDVDVQIDYSKSVDTVYADWAWRRINRRRTLDVLTACADSASSRPDGVRKPFDNPSWAPDLRRQLPKDNALFWHIHHLTKATRNAPWDCSLSKPLNATRSEDGKKLLLDGALVDKIVQMSSIGDPARTFAKLLSLSANLLAIIEDWERMVLTYFKLDRLENETQLAEMFSKTLLRGFREWGGESDALQAAEATLTERYKVWRGFSEVPDRFKSSPREIDGTREVQFVGTLERVLFHMINDCQMFISQSGRLGMVAGNCNARSSDGIWVLPGAVTPVILREGQGRMYYVMGPCFVHGCMFGEALSEIESRGGALVKITLI